MKLHTFTGTIAAFGLAAFSLLMSDLVYAQDARPTVIAQAKPPTLKENPATVTEANPGHATSALASHDCRNANGTVVYVPDTRCGGSHQYCKYDNGIVACIDTAD
jgi:hypothetical protein